MTRCALRLRGFCCGEDWVLWFKSYGLTRSYSIASSSSVFGKQIKCETAGRGVRAFAELGDRISRSQLRIRSDTFSHWIPCKGSSYYSQIQPQTQAFRQAAVTLAAGFSSNTSHCLPNFSRFFHFCWMRFECVYESIKSSLSLFTWNKMSSLSEADYRCQHGDTICGEFYRHED